MKNEIKDSGFLQPYDPERKVYVQSDASRIGLGYVLFQIDGDKRKKGEKIMNSDPLKTNKEKEEEKQKQKPDEKKKEKAKKEVEKRSIIQMSSTGLKPNQVNWSITELEMLAVVWSLEHSKYYTLANPDVHIITDHNRFIGILGKSLHQIDNTRLVKLLERINHY